MRILFAEDEEHIAKLIGFILKKEGHELTHAKDGQEALDLLSQKGPESFDLVLLDVMMPRKTGWQVLREIKEGVKTHSMKVVMLTAKSQDSDVKEATRLGADGFLNKPFKPEELRECLERSRG